MIPGNSVLFQEVNVHRKTVGVVQFFLSQEQQHMQWIMQPDYEPSSRLKRMKEEDSSSDLRMRVPFCQSQLLLPMNLTWLDRHTSDRIDMFWKEWVLNMKRWRNENVEDNALSPKVLKGVHCRLNVVFLCFISRICLRITLYSIFTLISHEDVTSVTEISCDNRFYGSHGTTDAFDVLSGKTHYYYYYYYYFWRGNGWTASIRTVLKQEDIRTKDQCNYTTERLWHKAYHWFREDSRMTRDGNRAS
jgi:hypothetical protein